MKIISWNVNGLRSIYKKGLPSFLSTIKPDILCLQETKLQEDQFTELSELKGHGSWTFSSAVKKGYSGVATCVSGKLSEYIKSDAKGIGISHFDTEGRFLISTHKKFVLYNIYFPSGTMGDVRQKFKYKFLDALANHISVLPKAIRKKLIICGDFNICHREIDIHHPDVATKRQLTGFLPDERKWMDKFCELDMIDTFRHVHGDVKDQYTWWTYRAGAREKNLGWRIDYFFVARELASQIRDAKILNQVTGSDHCPLLLDIDC